MPTREISLEPTLTLPREKTALIIRAMKSVKSDLKLVIAGSVRRREDQKYFNSCMKLVKYLGLENKVKIIAREMDFLCNHPEEVTKLEEGARRYAATFSEVAIAKLHLSVYGE